MLVGLWAISLFLSASCNKDKADNAGNGVCDSSCRLGKRTNLYESLFGGTNIINYAYDQEGRLLSWEDQYGSHSFTWSANQIVQVNETQEIEQLYILDNHGRVVERINSDSEPEARYEYNSLGYLSKIIGFYNGSPTDTFLYRWEGGNFTEVTGSAGQTLEYYPDKFFDCSREHLRIYGKYPKNLIKTIFFEGAGRSDYEYVIDGNGRVVRETEHVTGFGQPYSFISEFEYECD